MMNKIWKYTKRIVLTMGGIFLVLAGTGFAYRTYRLQELNKRAQTPNAIDDAMFVKIGGIDQWITIRGQNRDNPVVLLLHGGPGNAFQSLTSLELNPQRGWEGDFTLVRWDQRGAGKTYSKSGPVGPSVTVDRMALDGLEVAELLRRNLGKPKIILVGWSWGSVLGVKMARARPDLFYAYVGTGQVVNYGRVREDGYPRLMAEARARGISRAVRELEAIGPPPYASMSQETVYDKWADAFEPGMPSTWSNIRTALFDSPITVHDASGVIRGVRSSRDHFHAELSALDLSSETDFAIPIFFFQGALDNTVAPLKPWFDSLRAPQKQLVLIADAGHNAINTRRAEFLRLLVERVRPLATR